MQLHKNRGVIIFLTAAVSVVGSLVNQHVIPSSYGTGILAALGGLISGYGVAVVGSGPSNAASASDSGTPVPPATPTGVTPQTMTVPQVPGNAG